MEWPASQRIPSDDEDGQPQDAIPQPQRPQKGVKRPYRAPSPDLDDQPDLAKYFDQWEISIKEQVLMCRAYASYLAVQGKPRLNK